MRLLKTDRMGLQSTNNFLCHKPSSEKFVPTCMHIRTAQYLSGRTVQADILAEPSQGRTFAHAAPEPSILHLHRSRSSCSPKEPPRSIPFRYSWNLGFPVCARSETWNEIRREGDCHTTDAADTTKSRPLLGAEKHAGRMSCNWLGSTSRSVLAV
jgi:hypothetical protein